MLIIVIHMDYPKLYTKTAPKSTMDFSSVVHLLPQRPSPTQRSLTSCGVVWLFRCGAPLSGLGPTALSVTLNCPRAGGGDQPLSEKRGGETSVWPVDPAGCSLARARSRLQTRAQAHPAPGNWLTAAGVKGHRRGRSRRGQKQGRGHTCCLRFCARGHEAD